MDHPPVPLPDAPAPPRWRRRPPAVAPELRWVAAKILAVVAGVLIALYARLRAHGVLARTRGLLAALDAARQR